VIKLKPPKLTINKCGQNEHYAYTSNVTAYSWELSADYQACSIKTFLFLHNCHS